jgi:hypothetical protein
VLLTYSNVAPACVHTELTAMNASPAILAIITLDTLYTMNPPSFLSTSYGPVLISRVKSILVLADPPPPVPPVPPELGGVLGLLVISLSLEQDCIHPKIRMAAPLRPTFSIKSFLSIVAGFIFLKQLVLIFV